MSILNWVWSAVAQTAFKSLLVADVQYLVIKAMNTHWQRKSMLLHLFATSVWFELSSVCLFIAFKFSGMPSALLQCCKLMHIIQRPLEITQILFQLVNGEVLANSAIHVFFSALDCISQNLVIAAICTKMLRFNIFLKRFTIELQHISKKVFYRAL